MVALCYIIRKEAVKEAARPPPEKLSRFALKSVSDSVMTLIKSC